MKPSTFINKSIMKFQWQASKSNNQPTYNLVYFQYPATPFLSYWSPINCERSGGLIVSPVIPWASSPGLSPGQGQCVDVFLGKAPNSHSVSLHPGAYMGTKELLGKPNKLQGSDLQWTSILSRGSRNTPSHLMLQKLWSMISLWLSALGSGLGSLNSSIGLWVIASDMSRIKS